MQVTQELAKWFVSEILKQDFDFRFAGQHLKAAKTLVNPAEDVLPLDPEIVKLTILSLTEGKFGFDRPVVSLMAVTWGQPSYYQQQIDLIMQIPPVYEVKHYDTWVKKYGKLAQRLGTWDGKYLGWISPKERPFRLTPAEVSLALGD